MNLFYVLVIVTIFLLLIYHYLMNPYDYWKKQGVKSAPWPVPGLGHTAWMLCFRESLSDVTDRLYRSYWPETSMLGFFMWRTPVLIVRDAELVKTILIKKFSSFQNTLVQLNEQRDWFFGKQPFLASGDTWMRSRTTILNGMSSNKLKVVFEPMKRVCARFDDRLDELLSSNRPEVDLRNFCMSFTGEIVCKAGFGIDEVQRFNEICGKVFESSLSNGTRVLLNFYLPMIAEALGVSFISKEVRKYFADLTKRVAESRHVNRKKNEEVFLDLAMSSEDINDSTVAGVMAAFVIDAVESVATLVCFALYELTQRTDIQEKLQKEIHDTLAECKGNITYDALNEMTYLKQICSETIRLHMVLPISPKTCNKTTTLRGSDGQTCTLNPGDGVIIPMQTLHTDERNFSDPFTFDPNRFDENNKKNVPKFVFLPYGEGPRMCPGFRFGLLEMKIILVTILNKCSVKLSDRTRIPLEFDPRSLFLAVKGGLWMTFKRA